MNKWFSMLVEDKWSPSLTVEEGAAVSHCDFGSSNFVEVFSAGTYLPQHCLRSHGYDS